MAISRIRLSTDAAATLGAPKKPALRTRITDDLTEKFIELIVKGLPFDGVCDFLAIPSGSFYDWIRKGQLYIDSDGKMEEYEPYAKFVLEIRKACAQYRLNTLENLHRPGNRNWFRDLTILERRDRRNYSRTEPLGGSEDSYNPDEKFL